MAGRIFVDDPAIAADAALLRRIPPSWILWDEEGNSSISSAAFKDEELSVNIEALMIAAGRSAQDAIAGRSGFALASVTAAQARGLSQIVAADPIPEEPSHGVIFGRKTAQNVYRKLRDAAVWVVAPQQVQR